MEEKIYCGLIMQNDGWYKLYSDGNKNYSLKPWTEEDKQYYDKFPFKTSN